MKQSSTHIPSLLGALLFILGAVIVLGVAVLMGIVTLGKLLTGDTIQVGETILLAVTLFEGLLLLAAAYFSIQKLRQQPSADVESAYSISILQVAASLFLAGVAILIGHQIVNNEPVNWLFLPLLTLSAVILPILILFGLGIRGISMGPRWRTWNILGISMTLVPFITFFLEAVVIVFILFFVAIFLASQPALVAQLQRLSTQIYLLQTDPEALIELLKPLLLQPGILVIGLVLFALLVPLIEELLKPLGVWLFANQISSPAQGFALGALSGSAYALIETLGVTPQSADWATLLVTRLGTDILHVTTSALMGAGIVSAVRGRRYMRLLGTYLICVFLHGLWNSLAILFTFSTLANGSGQLKVLEDLAIPVAAGVALLAVLLLVILILTNLRMRAAQPQPVTEEPVP